MAPGFQTFLIAALIIAISYSVIILLITRGWFRLGYFRSNSPVPPATTVSIIIPARNESLTIKRCLAGLLEQDFPKGLTEIILVDDHSEDQTHQIMSELSGETKEVKIVILSLTHSTGKKAAIRLAMKFATGSFILCTDADCLHPAGWVSEMVRFFETKDPVFVSGPVLLTSGGNIFGRFQEFEFLSLVASGAGSIGAEMPIMCNGANLGFSAEAYGRLNGDAMKSGISSGDDIFLMLGFKEVFGPSRVSFVKSRNAIVRAEAKRTMAGFIRQRLRWVSKSRAYRDPFLILSAISVMLMNTCIFLTAIAGIFNGLYFRLALGLIVLKTIADYPLLISFSRFAGIKNAGWIIPVLEPFVVLITTFTAFAGNLFRNSWKGRKIY
ncbi:MAG: family 2 glycosyl transferase [Bacteroidetes bacterium]|nr:MAG: family 2 glycosyl transferase [Bacteroidota bacterium]